MLNRSTSKQNLKIQGSMPETELDALFHSYREALPDLEGSRDFMPAMWSRIEARQSQTYFFGRMSKALVTAALGASVLLGILVSSLTYQANAYFNGTYIEALSAQNPSVYIDPALMDLELQ